MDRRSMATEDPLGTWPADAPFAWEKQPALAQLTLSTWSVIRPYAQNLSIRPFDFLLVATPTKSLADFAAEYTVCCSDPRPHASSSRIRPRGRTRIGDACGAQR